MICRRSRMLVCGVAVLLTASGVGMGAAYNYVTGPNWVNMSATSCHAVNGFYEHFMQRAPGELKSTSTGGPDLLAMCPINRRSTTFYGAYKAAPGTPNRETTVNIQSITVRGRDNGAGKLLCFAWGTDLATGSTTFSTNKYFCQTSGGCTTAPNPDYTGTNSVSLSFAFPTKKMVNWGYGCTMNPGSSLYYSETSITPNN